METVFVIAADLLEAECLGGALAALRDLRVIGLAALPVSASACHRWRSDLFVIDLSAPETVGLAATLASDDPQSAIIGYRVPPALGELFDWSRVGIRECVPAGASLDDLVAAVDGVVPPDAASRNGSAGSLGVLTFRESEILALISEGRSNTDIATLLHLQYSTVKNHVHSILSKLEVGDRGEAAAWYHRHSLLSARRY
jgi:DNA-binding NarL/FixJ family response regulator